MLDNIFSSKKDWHPIELPTEDRWPANNIFKMDIAGKPVVISILSGKYYAFNDHCPHASVSLTEDNQIINDCISCSLHGYKFNIRTGLCVSGEEYKLKKYRLEQREEGWYIEI